MNTGPARRSRGYTLIEITLALAIAGVLGGIAVDSIGSALETCRANDAKAQLLASVMRGSTRAGVTAGHVVLCPSIDLLSCSSGRDWSQGWIAFSDLDLDRERTPDEPAVGSYPALTGKVRLTSTTGRTRMVFQPNGGNAGSNITFTLCDGRGPKKAVSIVINNAGRMRYGIPNAEGIAATCPS